MGWEERYGYWGIRVKKEINYLGISIDKKGDMGQNVEKRILMGRRMVGYIAYVIRGESSRVELGKTIWKSVVVPAIMYGLAAIRVNGRQMEELEREQGRMYRCILGLPKRVAKEFLEAEIGSSSFTDRIGKAKIRLVKKVLDRNERLRDSIVERWDKGCEVLEEVKSQLRKRGIEEVDLDEEEWRGSERRFDENRRMEFLREMERKESLRWYREVRRRKVRIGFWGGEEEKVTKLYWSGAMRWRLRLDFEVEGRCGICGGEYWGEHVIEGCAGLEEWRREFGEEAGSVDEIMCGVEAVMGLERRREGMVEGARG